jgi:tyrosyl-tRNA synthetase
MLPLLPGTDGVDKMSKSLGNYIGIHEPAPEIYGKTLSIPDPMILPYLTLATEVATEEIKAIGAAMQSGQMNPRDAKRRLARELVALYHSHEAAEQAEAEFDKLFAKKEVPEDVAEYRVPENGDVPLAKLIVDSGGAKSNSEARRLIEGGGVQLDGLKVTDVMARIKVEQPKLLKVGKRFFVRLVPAA